jgi:hypothetical protein
MFSPNRNRVSGTMKLGITLTAGFRTMPTSRICFHSLQNERKLTKCMDGIDLRGRTFIVFGEAAPHS